MPGEAAPAATKEKEAATPNLATAGFEPTSFGSTGIRSHEQAILNLQETAGNRAVVQLLSGIQRAPMLQRIQRAPVAEGTLNPPRRAELIRQAVKDVNVGVRMLIVEDVEKIAEPLEGMTADEGRQVRQLFQERYGWSLRDMIGNAVEIGGQKVPVEGIGPKNRRRLALLLAGTVAPPTPDPMDALEKGQALGNLIGAFTGQGDELGNTLGAVAAVAARDEKAAKEKEFGARRRTSQAIELKGWLDKGQKDRVFALIRSLSMPDRLDERKALSDAYEAEFGEGLYIALTKRMKDPVDFQRVGALWDNDLAKDDRLVTEAKVAKVKKAEAALPKLPEGIKPEHLVLGADGYKQGQKRLRDAKADLDAHLDEMSKQPAVGDAATPGGPGTGAAPRTRLDAALGEGTGTAGVRYEIKQRSGVKADDLFDPARRPLVIAARLAQQYRDGLITAADVEHAIREVRAAADAEALRQMRAHAAKAGNGGSGDAGGSNDGPAPSPEVVVDAQFVQFQAEFEAKAGKPLPVVLAGLGSAVDRRRNRALLREKGAIDELAELNFAVNGKDMDRLRAILGDKTGPEIRELADDFRARYHRDLGTSIVGTPDEIRRIRNPTPDDLLSGRLPKDLPKARKDLEDKIMLLKGAYAFEPTGSMKAQLDFVQELATTRDFAGTSGATGAVPVTDQAFEGLVDRVGTQADRESIREEARFVLSRILGREITTDANRGLFARARDEFGNIDRRIVRQTREDALAAVANIDKALDVDPPNIAAARGQITTLYIAEQRMQHNLGVYEENTELAFNAFVDAAVLVASTIATAGAGGVIAGAIRATAATLATKFLAKGPDYLTSRELFDDIRGGVFSAVGGKLADKVVGRFVQGWAAKILKNADEIGAGFKARAAAAGAKSALYAADQAVSGTVSGGLESLVQGDIDPLKSQFGATNVVTGVAQAGAHKMLLGARAKVDDLQWSRARKKAERRAAASSDAGSAPAPSGPRAGDATTTALPELPAGPGVEHAAGPLPATTGPRPAADAGPTAGSGDALHSVSSGGWGRDGGSTENTAVGRRPRAAAGPTTDTPTPAGRERPLRPSEFEVPPTRRSGRQLGIDPRSGLDTPRGRRNRESQLRRSGELTEPGAEQSRRPLDAELLEQSTGPRTGRAFAAEFAPAVEGWVNLSPDEKTARIEDVVNKMLAKAGMPRVKVRRSMEFDPGDAAFVPGEWEMVVSAEGLIDSSEASLAKLANSVAHETRHALHIFRGVRAKLHADASYVAPIKVDALEAARTANATPGIDPAFRPPSPGVEGSPAYGESLDVIAETFGEGTPDRPAAVGAGAVAKARRQEVVTERQMLESAQAQRPPDQARIAFHQRRLEDAERRFRLAHNRYVRTAPEADAHRAGPAAERAFHERSRLKDQLAAAEAAAQNADARLREAHQSRDADRIREATADVDFRHARLRSAREALDALLPTPGGADLASLVGAEPQLPAPGAGPTPGTVPRARPGSTTQRMPIVVPGGDLASVGLPGSGDGRAGGRGSVDPIQAAESKLAAARKAREAADADLAAVAGEGLHLWVARAEPTAVRARARLAEAEARRDLAKLRAAAAPAGPERAGTEREAAEAEAKVGDAQEALSHAQTYVVRASRVGETLGPAGPSEPKAESGPAPKAQAPRPTAPPNVTEAEALDGLTKARAERSEAETKLANVPGNGMDLWIARAEPALQLAKARLKEAEAAHLLATLKELAASDADRARLGREAAEAGAKVGDAQNAVGDAQNQVIRAERLAEGLERSRATADARAARRRVVVLENVEEAAREFVESGGYANGNVAIRRREIFERQWQDVRPNAAARMPLGWRRADGKVVLDASNPHVRAAIERQSRILTRSRT